MWFVCYFVRIFLSENVQWICYATGIRAEQMLNLAIYDKMMRLSGTYRKFLREGDFITHFNVHTRIVANFLMSSWMLFSAPTTLILACVFVFTEVGAYGAILPSVVVITLILLVLIDLKVTRLLLSKHKHYNDRLTCNL